MGRWRDAPWHDPTKPHHGPDGFRNPDGSRAGHEISVELAREGAHFMASMQRLLGDSWDWPPDHVVAREDVLRQWQAGTPGQRLLWLGHACFLADIGGVHVLTDPFLTEYASPVPLKGTKRLIPAALSVSALPAVDVILLSHNHYDHLDAPAMKALARRFPGVRVVVPLGLGRMMRSLGFRQVLERDWWDTLTLDGLEVTLVPALHTSRRGLFDTNHSLWCGFMFGAAGVQLYFAGDTAYGNVFREIGRRCGPVTLGLVPIGAYLPRVLMAPVHCTPEEAALIGRDVGATELVGMHWGTLRLALEPMDEPRERFLAAREGPPRSVMRIGETRSFSARA